MKQQRIRFATLEDALQIATINIQAWQLAYQEIVDQEVLSKLSIEKSTRAIEKRLHEQPHEIMIIENHTEIEGFIGFGDPRDEDVNPQQVAEIYTVYFSEKYYGNGSAKKLMMDVLTLLRQQKIKEVVLWVFEENERALHFYKKIGFNQITNRKLYKGKTPEIRLSYYFD